MKGRQWRRQISSLLLMLLLSLACMEAVLRLFASDLLALRADERTLLYRPDTELGWTPRPGRSEFMGHAIEHNQDGLRNPELGPRERPRVAVFGDSMVWGWGVAQDQHLSAWIERLEPGLEAVNLGVSGYGTDQALLLWRRWAETLQADVVILVVCIANDRADNRSNMRYGGYLKPYFVVQDGQLQLRGQPVLESPRHWLRRHPRLAQSYLVRAGLAIWRMGISPGRIEVDDPTLDLLDTFGAEVAARGATWIVALSDAEPELQAHLAQRGVQTLILSAPERMADGVHWTELGNRQAAESLLPLIQAALPATVAR